MSTQLCLSVVQPLNNQAGIYIAEHGGLKNILLEPKKIKLGNKWHVM